MYQTGSSPGNISLSQALEGLLSRQDTLTTGMAQNLESLAAHYDQMKQVLRDHGMSADADLSPPLVVGSAETYKAPVIEPRRSSAGELHARGIDMPGRSRAKPPLGEDDIQGDIEAVLVGESADGRWV